MAAPRTADAAVGLRQTRTWQLDEWQRLLDRMADGIVVVDEAGRIVRVNKTLEEVTGYTRAALVGESIEVLVPKTSRVTHRDLRADYQRAPHARAMNAVSDIECVRRDGTSFPADVSLSPLEAAGGTLIVATIRDVTEQRRSRDKLARLNRLHVMEARVSAAMSRTHDPTVLVDRICKVATNEVGFPAVAIAIRDQPGRTARRASVSQRMLRDGGASELVRRTLRELGDIAMAQIPGTGHVCLSVESLARGPRWSRPLLACGIGAVAAFAIASHGTIAGHVSLFAPDTAWFGEEEATVLDALAQAVGLFLDAVDEEHGRERAEGAVKRRVRQQEIVARFAEHAPAAQDMEVLFGEVYRSTRQGLECDQVSILELSADGTEFRLHGSDEDSGRRIPADLPSPYTPIIESGASVVVDDLRREARFPIPSSLLEHGLLGGVSSCIPGAERPFGVLCAHTREPGILDDDDVVFVESIARILGSTIRRRAAETALRETEERFRRLVENAPVVIFRQRLEPEPTLEYISQTITTLTGLQPQAFYDDASLLQTLVHPDDREVFARGLREPDQLSKPLRGRYQDRTGDLRWFECSVRAVYDQDDAVVATEGIARDITDQIEAEESSAAAAQLSRSVLESLTGHTAVLEPGGAVISVNRAWSKYAAENGGQVTDVAEGANYLAVCERSAARGCADAAVVLAGLRGVLAGEIREFQHDYQCSSPGKERWFTVRATPLDTSEGGLVIIHTDITWRKEAERDLTRQAHRDPLTGLENRAVLFDRLGSAIGELRQRGRVGLLFIDVDRFKFVNDAHGHDVGDYLLRLIARRLETLTREGDTVARFGGDEFVVLIQAGRRARALRETAERLRRELTKPYAIGSSRLAITVSIGVAHGSPHSLPDALLRNANAALHVAKDHGRDRVEAFDRELRQRVVARLDTEKDLREAIDAGTLQLAYQPVVALATGRISGVEALLRWKHPEQGLILPPAFIAIAEETGLIVPVGRWVLQEACRQARRLSDALPANAPFFVAVNLSARQLAEGGFEMDVESALRTAGIAGRCLTVEITESALMEPFTKPEETFRALRRLGVRLALDDFGTGYSSLSYLKRFAIDYLKLDGGFVAGLGRGRGDDAIIAAVVGMARALDLHVIAEGVETHAQRAALLEFGCEYAQGFLFARPEPAERVRERLVLQYGSANLPPVELDPPRSAHEPAHEPVALLRER